jgi:hypothetical protein
MSRLTQRNRPLREFLGRLAAMAPIPSCTGTVPELAAETAALRALTKRTHHAILAEILRAIGTGCALSVGYDGFNASVFEHNSSNAQREGASVFMNVIRPNCRIQFTAEDIDFIVSILGKKAGDTQCLIQLLADETSRDQVLDDEFLYRAFLEHRGCLQVSSHLYFYVLTRHALRLAGIEDRTVADYVAEILCEFSRAERTRCVIPGSSQPLDYFFEMLAALRTADERTSFYIRTHIGNQSLFLSGVFPERIRFRAEYRGFPDLKYYEAIGQANFRVASDHRLAEKYALASIFTTLADRFQTTRIALNDLAERIFSLGDTDYALDTLWQAP